MRSAAHGRNNALLAAFKRARITSDHLAKQTCRHTSAQGRLRERSLKKSWLLKSPLHSYLWPTKDLVSKTMLRVYAKISCLEDSLPRVARPPLQMSLPFFLGSQLWFPWNGCQGISFELIWSTFRFDCFLIKRLPNDLKLVVVVTLEGLWMILFFVKLDGRQTERSVSSVKLVASEMDLEFEMHLHCRFYINSISFQISLLKSSNSAI